ncbi:MAG: O-antigen ligase family protein [Patescibacteria group bacterium]
MLRITIKDTDKDYLLNISKKLFLLLVLLIPLNLGKHFITSNTYVWGVLVDYLIPTIYIQDILVLVIVILWILSGCVKRVSWKKILTRREIQFSLLFTLSTLFSVLSASRLVPSMYFWIRLFLYFLIFIYTFTEIKVEDYFFEILDAISLSVLLVSVIGILQYLNKGSIFNNYLFLGEQPYSASTWGIAKESLLGNVVVPSYGLFRHPNTFGGFLALSLILIFSFIKKRKFYVYSFIFGLVALFCTFSYSSWLAFVFGLIIHLFLLVPSSHYKHFNDHKKKIKVLLITSLFSLAMLIIPLFPRISKSINPSLYRRSNLLISSYKIFKEYPLFGVGLNNLTIFIDRCVPESRDIRFTQPVHNIFALIAAETGIFSFILFLLFLFFVSKRLVNSSYFHVFLISFAQILVLGSLDHYFLTIHQTLLMFWIILGLSIQ